MIGIKCAKFKDPAQFRHRDSIPLAHVNAFEQGVRDMGLFQRKHFDSFETLFLDQLADLYDAEKQLCVALPKMAEAAHSIELQQAFRRHLLETEDHVLRLERIFHELGREPLRESCPAMSGMIQEGKMVIDASGEPAVKDAALIAAAQRVEHYEIAAYGTARTFAEYLGHGFAGAQLEKTLEEEKATDVGLTEIAERFVNLQATTTSPLR
jgi:ferritin-like metal-binding protein YciE